MIELINKVTGGKMWVDESRLDEYLAAGYKPAAKAVSKTDPEPVKTPARKTTRKK